MTPENQLKIKQLINGFNKLKFEFHKPILTRDKKYEYLDFKGRVKEYIKELKELGLSQEDINLIDRKNILFNGFGIIFEEPNMKEITSERLKILNQKKEETHSKFQEKMKKRVPNSYQEIRKGLEQVLEEEGLKQEEIDKLSEGYDNFDTKIYNRQRKINQALKTQHNIKPTQSLPLPDRLDLLEEEVKKINSKIDELFDLFHSSPNTRAVKRISPTLRQSPKSKSPTIETNAIQKLQAVIRRNQSLNDLIRKKKIGEIHELVSNTDYRK